MKTDNLLFWHFFKVIDQSLSYERWIDKYKLFLQALENGHIRYDEELKGFKQFCRILYLQDNQDESLFNQLLDQAIEREKDILKKKLDAARQIAKPREAPVAPPMPRQQHHEAEDIIGQQGEAENEESITPPPSKAVAKPTHKTMYYKTPLSYKGMSNGQGIKPLENAMFLHTDEYFSVTRRTMVKGWQFLRYKEKSIATRELDISATTFKIAQEGLFLSPVYKPGTRNREDTLIILADVRGSMTPFHELTNRLIATARQEGGHPRAPVFYFQNCPVGYVYRKSNLAEPVKIKEAMLKANRNVTIAIVISDAGAARGNTNAQRVNERTAQTKEFIHFLYSTCAHVIWLNPVPKHRWAQTAADRIKDEVLHMASVFEQDVYNFQDTLRTIFKQNI